MARNRPRPIESQLRHIVIGSLPVLGFVGGLLWYSFTVGRFAQDIATKNDLGDTYKASIKYTDETAAHVLKQAFDHSDANRQGMMLELERMKTDIKTDQAKTDGKVDSILQMLQTLREDLHKGRVR